MEKASREGTIAGRTPRRSWVRRRTDDPRASWGPRLCAVSVAGLVASICLLMLAPDLVSAGLGAALLPSADASATVGPPPAEVSGLPDSRVYEQVSPPNKNGNFVASGGGAEIVEGEGYAAASADGHALVFLGTGAMGDAVSGVLGPYVARRSSSGWSTTSATPAQVGLTSLFGLPKLLVPSHDFSRFVFGSIHEGTRYSPEEPEGPLMSVDLYLTEDPFIPPVWLGKPAIDNPIPLPGENETSELGLDFGVAGASPTLNTVYFTYSGTLIPQDASRAPNVGDGTAHDPHNDPWGFYEWSAGTLASAGVLPDGSVSPFGAVPADVAGDERAGGGAQFGTWQARGFDNVVSLDGSRAFFVSPDPVASTVTDLGRCGEEGHCTTEPPELYVRETNAKGEKQSVLVSQSQLPGHVGAPAPDGAVSVEDAPIIGAPVDSTYAYASPDGSHVFFASTDRLTEAAPEDATVKEYDFDVDTGTLAYLPGVVGPIVASSRDGSDLVFKNTATTPEQLDLWSAGPSGGQVKSIAELPKPVENGKVSVEARASTDGSIFVFETNAPIPGFNDEAGFGEVYRYEVASNAMTCVSCLPAGMTPSGNATISYDNAGGSNGRPRSTVDTRVISSDGSRVFFDSPDPLVPQATNGKRNVYEWEAGGRGSCAESPGCIYLISSGKSSENSFYLDNSESGGDVFFSTSEGLAPADTDGASDAYDARIPQPGEAEGPAAAPCQGEACRPLPATPAPVGTPATAGLNGAGNVMPAEPARSKPRTLTRSQKLARALKVCHGKKKARARRECEARARKRYGPASEKKSTASRRVG